MKKIPAIILAAGESKRMGTLKPLLPVRGRTLLESQIELISTAGAFPVKAVLGFKHKAILKAVGPISFVLNKNFKLGQFSSLQAGLRSITNKTNGAMILNVDCPFVKGSTVKAILRNASRSKAPAVIPVYKGKWGHPIWISAKLVSTILKADPKTGRLDMILRGIDGIETIRTRSRSILNNTNTIANWLEAK